MSLYLGCKLVLLAVVVALGFKVGDGVVLFFSVGFVFSRQHCQLGSPLLL